MDEEYTLVRSCGCSGSYKIFFTYDINELARVAVVYSELGEVSLEVTRHGRYVSHDKLEEHRRIVESKIEELSDMV